MAKIIQLEIVWDGPLPSLMEHRVSLNAFADPLCNLLSAARRIASNMVSDALEPAATGRLAKAAHQIDIELTGVIGNSGGVATVMTFQSNNSQQPLFNDMTENVGTALLDAIDAERQGILKNLGVRKYLQSLPSILTRQSYNLHENGRSIRHFEFGTMALPETPTELPYLMELSGRISGVGFEPWEVRIKSDETRTIVPATQKQVERALEYRNTEVRALILRHGLKSKLLKLEENSAVRFRPDPETHIFARWNNLLQRLAQ
jgi:hypothetical protein